MKILANLVQLLILACPFAVGPLCLVLVVAKWVARRQQSDKGMSAYNRRLAVSLVLWIPFTGFMCLLCLFMIMGDPCDDPVLCPPPSLTEVAAWLSIPVVYICTGAWLVYLMWAPTKRPLR